MRAKSVVMGIDLSASEKRHSGVCILRNLSAETLLVKTDEELLSIANRLRPQLIAIDAPLSLPIGEGEKSFRRCDLDLLRRGIPLFPITFGAMKKLAERGIKLKAMLESIGCEVVEVFPGGAQDLLGLPRKHRNLEGLRKGLERLGLRGLKPTATGDELDAATAALVGLLWLNNLAELVDDGKGGGIVMPAKDLALATTQVISVLGKPRG